MCLAVFGGHSFGPPTCQLVESAVAGERMETRLDPRLVDHQKEVVTRIGMSKKCSSKEDEKGAGQHDGLPEEPVFCQEDVDGQTKVGGGVESDDRSQGFCFAEPPTGDEGKEGGGSEFNVDHGKGNGGDIKREGLKSPKWNFFKLWFDNGPHEEATPKELFDDGDDEYGAKHAKGNGKEPGQKTEFKSGGERESVVAFSGAGHPWIESNPENNCAEAKKDGVAKAGRGRILTAVSGSEPQKKCEDG